MALANLAALQAAILAPHQRIQFTKNSITTAQGRLYDFFMSAPGGGTAPTTAVVPTRATAGALGQFNPTADLHLIGTRVATTNWTIPWLYDRLSHQGGLVGNVATVQTTNLPTAALTRYTSGEGVMIGLHIYTVIGTSIVTVFAEYTNQAGTAGRVTPDTVFGGTGFREAQRMIILPLQEGDYGVQSVESVQITGLGGTGTAGNFGVMLIKPLVMTPVPVCQQAFEWLPILGGLGGLAPEIVDNACLSFLVQSAGTSSGILQGEALFAES